MKHQKRKHTVKMEKKEEGMKSQQESRVEEEAKGNIQKKHRIENLFLTAFCEL